MNVCKFCGAAPLPENDHGYQCASWRYSYSDVWTQSPRCRNRCQQVGVQHEQTIKVLERRIATAVEATQQANRFDLVSGRHGGIDAESDIAGCYAWASVLDDIAGILQGNSPEIPEGSEEST